MTGQRDHRGEPLPRASMPEEVRLTVEEPHVVVETRGAVTMGERELRGLIVGLQGALSKVFPR